MRFRGELWGVIAVLALGATAWYLRPVVAVHRIGLPWRATLRRSHCTRGPFGEFCTTNWPRQVDPTVVTTVNLEPRSRALLRADRWWRLRDTAAWSPIIDSLRHSFVEKGLERLPCDSAVTHFPIAEAWRTGSYEVELFGARAIHERDGRVHAGISVQLLPFGGGSCGTRYGRRLLTPDEMAERVSEWIGEQIGLR
jgi:hypothetical protein